MSVQLNLTGDGLNLNREISFTQAGKIIAFIGSEESLPGKDGSIEPTISLGAGELRRGRQSLRELIDNASAITNSQKIVVLGNYIAQESEESVFTSEQVKTLFPKAGERLPKNFSRDLQSAITSNWIEELPDRNGAYFITRTGEDGIANGFSAGTSARNTTTRRSSSSKAPSQLRVRDEVSSIALYTPELEGYPNYHKLPTKSAKILWILAFATTHGIDSLRPNEIAYIAGRVRDKIDPRDINGLTSTAARNGWVAKDSSSFYALLHKGDEYVRGIGND